MSALHVEGVLSLLEGLPYTLYRGQVPDRPSFPYVVVFADTGREDSSGRRLTGHARDAFDVQVNSVALSDAAVRVVADDVRRRLLNARPTIPGRRCGLIRHQSSIPVRADRDVTDPDTGLNPMWSADMYTFQSVPE